MREVEQPQGLIFSLNGFADLCLQSVDKVVHLGFTKISSFMHYIGRGQDNSIHYLSSDRKEEAKSKYLHRMRIIHTRDRAHTCHSPFLYVVCKLTAFRVLAFVFPSCRHLLGP
jgi:hypothetical protein